MKNIKMILSLILVAMLVLGFAVGCDDDDDDDGGGEATGSVVGTVRDIDGNPVQGATVSITDDSVRATITDITDDFGDFWLSGVYPGTWPLTITKAGYITKTFNVTVEADTTVEISAEQGTVTPEAYGSVTGHVSDKDTGASLADVTVSMAGSVDITGVDGRYSLDNILVGTHTMTASKTGYLAYSASITIFADQIITNDFTMESEEPVPDPGKGNVRGKVVDASGNALAGVAVSEQRDDATTGPDGMYLVRDLEPGARILSYAKSGYTSTTQTVTVIANETVVAPQITLSAEPQAGLTTWVSHRVNLPEQNDAEIAHVNEDGSVVVFESNGNVINNWNTPAGIWQIYVWKRSTGAITRVSNNNNVPGSTAGANAGSFNARVSGDGNVVVFESAAQDILPSGLATGSNGDIYLVNISNLSSLVPVRVSRSSANANVGGNAASQTPDVNYDGTAVVFSSQANNLAAVATTAGYDHIYYSNITAGTPGIARLIDQLNGAEAIIAGPANPVSINPRISKNGRFTAFESGADTAIVAAPGVVGGAASNIFRNDINGDPALGWNIQVSKHDGIGPVAGEVCIDPAINEDGKKIAFTSDAAGFPSGDGFDDVYLWSEGSSALNYVSRPLAGAKGNSDQPGISYDGKIVIFRSATVGLVPEDTDVFTHVFAKDVTAGTDVYTLVSKGASGQLPNAACNNPAISGNGSYVVFDTAATNLTGDSFTLGNIDVFLHKWR